MEHRTLNILWQGRTIEVKVDTDMLLMRDLYDYIVEKFDEIGVELPQYPFLCHSHRGVKYDVMDGTTLLRVFEINLEEQLEFVVCGASKAGLTWELAMVNNISSMSRTCKVHSVGNGEFEIEDGTSFLPLSLNQKTCTCGKWQITGIPCVHAMRAINHMRCSYMPYVSDWFSVRKYKMAYGLNIHPMPSDERWPAFDLPKIDPPPMKRSIGRPARNRRREQGEQRKRKRSTTVRCKKCKAPGHNSKTCRGGPTAKEVRQQEASSSQPKRVPKRKKQRAEASSSQPTQPHQSISEGDSVSFASQPSSTVPSSSMSTRGRKQRQPI